MRINFYLAPQIEIYEKTASTDAEGNPVYDWSLLATERAFFIGKVKSEQKEGATDLKGKPLMIFQPSSVVAEEHRVKYQNKTYRVNSVLDVEFRDRILYKLVEVELVEG